MVAKEKRGGGGGVWKKKEGCSSSNGENLSRGKKGLAKRGSGAPAKRKKGQKVP